jgi:C1A family cysteine protease
MFKINKPATLIAVPSIIIKFIKPNFGYLEDVPNDKDYLFSNSPIANNPALKDISLKGFFKEISDQYTIGSCVANAIADSLEAQFAQRKNLPPSQIENLSRLFIYYNARNLETPPSTGVDNGTRIRYALDSVRIHGVPSETVYPYDTSKVFLKPGWLIYKAAIQNKINTFYRIDATGDNRITQIKQALSAGCPVVFGTKVAESFRNVNSYDTVNLPTDKYIGGHAMCITGWNSAKQAFEVRNSWGPYFGVNGYCYMSPNYLKADITRDLWVML